LRHQAIQRFTKELALFAENRARKRRELIVAKDEKATARITENITSADRRIAELKWNLHRLRTRRFKRLVRQARKEKPPSGNLTHSLRIMQPSLGQNLCAADGELASWQPR
jgi:hypothetical protein